MRLIRHRLKESHDLKKIFERKQTNNARRGSIKNVVESLAAANKVGTKAIYQSVSRGMTFDDIRSGKRRCSLRQVVAIYVRKGESANEITNRFIHLYRRDEIIKCCEEVTFVDMAERKTDLSRNTIYGRIKLGWSREEIVSWHRKRKIYRA